MERSDVSTNISTRESTIFVWKIIVFIIFPSSLWSERLSEALETLVYACKSKAKNKSSLGNDFRYRPSLQGGKKKEKHPLLKNT